MPTSCVFLEHVLKDPSFIQCLNQHAGADPADYVNVVATCYGFVGRPRSVAYRTRLLPSSCIGLFFKCSIEYFMFEALGRCLHIKKSNIKGN